MANDNNHTAQIPAATAPSPVQPQPLPQAHQQPEDSPGALNTLNPAVARTQGTPPSAAQVNTPLAGSLNSKPPFFYVKATAAQLRAIIQSAPTDVRSRIRANASKEVLIDEVLKLRQNEAIAATTQQPVAINPHEALHRLLTMDASDVTVAVDSNPDNLRRSMHAALQADQTLAPRIVPEGRLNLIHTIITWQVNAHTAANPSGTAAATPQHGPPTQLADQLPPTLVNQPASNTQANPDAPPQTAAPVPAVHHGPSLNDILAVAPTATGPHRTTNPANRHDMDDSDDELDATKKRNSDDNHMESWIQGFHTGADAALEHTLSENPENRPGANRLNVTTFRGPKILGKIITQSLGLQQHVATFPFWKKSTNGRPTQSHMEAQNLARMMQLEFLAHKTPLEALRHRPSLEVGLRRLYAIMYVEKQIATGEMPDRGTAWHNIQFLLESTPSDASTCDDIEEEMTRRLTQSKRRIAATKAITESDTRRPRRSPNNKGQSSNQDANKRRNQPADSDGQKE